MEVKHGTAIAFDRFYVGTGYPDHDEDGPPFVALTFEDEAEAQLTFALTPGQALRIAEKLVRRVQVERLRARP